VSGGALAGRSVLVAGASRGIGAAVAAACARAGASHVALAARGEAALARVAGVVEEAGAAAQALACDLTDPAAARAAVDAATGLDVLVYAAGTNRPQPFAEVDAETYDALFAVNIRAAFFTAQAAAQRMLREGTSGAIVLISSQMGHVGAVRRTVYCATKHAVEGLVKAMALELAPAGIRAVSVAPTFVRTDMTASQLDDPSIGPGLLAQIPLGRWATPDEVAGAVVWAASPAAAMLTGTSVVLDGGWTAR
jgi:NAD(P)-dependent dehydrogenase (short-subunit alcohol dehydrogenase family)